MTSPQLLLLSKPTPVEDHTPLYVDIDSSQLWELVNDEQVHLVLRKPALLELARRKDIDLVDYCEQLLTSNDYEKWLTALTTLAAIGSSDAVDRLILAYAQSLNENRKVVLSVVAKILTAEHVRPFSIMAREIAIPGEIDITGWTRVAILTLQEVCRRFGLEAVRVGDFSDSHDDLGTEDICLDHLASLLPPEN